MSDELGEVPRPLALLVAGTFFMEMLDGTIVATAAPRIAQSFGVRSVDIAVAITAYLLTLAVLIPLSGWIADRWGARRVFVVAIAIFTVASGLCAGSVSLPMLVGMRVLQGAGGALMVPVGRLAVLRSTDRAKLMQAIAYLTWPGLAAPVLAPALGGLITTYASWHVIFLVNVPLGVLALIVAIRVVPDVRGPARGPLDWPGFLICAVCVAGIVYCGALLSEADIRLDLTVASGTVALVFGALAVWYLRHSPRPLLDLSVFRIRTFGLAHGSGFLFRAAINSVPFLLPLMFQDAFGWSPLRSGIAVVFAFLGNIVIKPVTSPLLRRFGFRAVLVGSGLAAGMVVALCALFRPGWSVAPLLSILLLSGVFRSISFTGYNTVAFADVEPERMTHANTLASTLQQLAIGVGVAFGAVSLRIGEAVLGEGQTRIGPYRVALLLVAAVLTSGGVLALRAPHDAGAVMGVRTGSLRRRERSASKV